MEVYQLSLAFAKRANTVRGAFLPGRSALADQLDRAAVSIVLNVAEGAGEFARREKARFYRIARRSATECAAILDVASQLEIADGKLLEEAKDDLRKIVAMLVGLSKWAEDSAPTDHRTTS
jgi:four helix bundle protein